MAVAAVSVALLAPASASADSFAFMCKPSHRLQDDPIVSFGRTAGHSHDFFGNRSTDRWSTRESLYASSPTLCSPNGDDTADRSAYWFPTLLQRDVNGELKPVNPNYSTVYYRKPVNDGASVRPFPAGLQVVAGDAAARSAQPRAIVDWMCYNGYTDGGRPVPYCHDSDPTDAKRPSLRLKLQFPSCSNGEAESFDDKSHLAYPTSQRTCPSTHPIPIPKIEMFTYYPTAGGPDADDPDAFGSLLPGATKLSSGGHLSAHGDFFEAWDEVKLNYMMAKCIWPPSTGCVSTTSL